MSTMFTEKKQLDQALKSFRPLVPRKTTFPVLENIHLVGRGSHLELTASDLDTHYRLTIPGGGEGDGLLPFRQLADNIRSMSGRLEITLDTARAAVRNGSLSSFATTADPAEFPAWPALKKLSASFNLENPPAALDRVCWAVNRTEKRQLIRNILVERAGGVVRLVATNGHVLAALDLPDHGPDFVGLIPGAAADLVRQSFSAAPAKIEFYQFEKGDNYGHVRFTQDGRELIARINSDAAAFPKYRQVMPDPGAGRVLNLDRAQLIKCLPGLIKAANTATRRVGLVPADAASGCPSVRLCAWDPNRETGAAHDLDTLQGTAAAFGYPVIFVNGQYLLDLARAVPGDIVSLVLPAKNHEGILARDIPADMKKGSWFQAVVMPLKVEDPDDPGDNWRRLAGLESLAPAPDSDGPDDPHDQDETPADPPPADPLQQFRDMIQGSRAGETKAVKAALESAGIMAKVTHGRGTAWGWIEIHAGKLDQFGEHQRNSDGHCHPHYCPRCLAWRALQREAIAIVQAVTGRHGEYHGNISFSADTDGLPPHTWAPVDADYEPQDDAPEMKPASIPADPPPVDTAPETNPATNPAPAIAGPDYVDSYKDNPLFCIPVNADYIFKFGLSKARLVIEHSRQIQLFAHTADDPGLADWVENYKGRPVFSIPVTRKYSFSFGQQKAKLLVENLAAIDHFVTKFTG